MPWNGASSVSTLLRLSLCAGTLLASWSCAGRGNLGVNGGAGAGGSASGGSAGRSGGANGGSGAVGGAGAGGSASGGSAGGSAGVNGGSGAIGSAGVGGSTGVDGGAGESAVSDGGTGPSDASVDDAQSMSRYRAIGIATAEEHACALLDNHGVKCWGDNVYGQLGYGDKRTRGISPADMGNGLPFVDLGTGRTATKVVAGKYDTCAILDDGSLKCWGWSQLNGGSAGDIGDAPGEMGDNLKPLDFGGRHVIDVAIGSYTACAAADDNTIWCWSAGVIQLQTGLPAKSIKMLTAAEHFVIALYSDGTVSPLLTLQAQASGSASAVLYPSLFPSSQTFLTVSGAADQSETCGLSNSNTVVCNWSGILVEPLTLSGPAIALGMQLADAAQPTGLCVLFADGSVQCPDDKCNGMGEYWCDAQGHIAVGGAATAISSGGSSFSCVTLADGSVKCWGYGPDPNFAPWRGSSVSNGTWAAIDLGSHP